jgi:TetR/AcrR family transcriptional regulator
MALTKIAASKPRLGSRGRPEQTRAAILQAATREFSREGIAGARIDAIARAARVNKALLYYYFADKDALYGAVLDQVFGGLTAAVFAVLSHDLPPREKLLAYAGTHFDYIASHPLYPRIVQGEMMRAARGGATQLERIVKQYFRPLFGKLSELLRQGQEAGEFRAVDPLHFIPSMIAVITFYFTSAPAMRLVTGADPMSPERVLARRMAVLDFISTALFRNPSPHLSPDSHLQEDDRERP